MDICPDVVQSNYLVQTSLDNSHNDAFLKRELRIVLLGITGAGKSSSGNAILGQKSFVSKVCSSSVTSKCLEKKTTRFGHDIVIIDTPGFCDTHRSEKEITKEIVRCIGLSSPGPHAFVMVLKVGRFTKEEQAKIAKVKEVFGQNMTNYLFVLFTRLEDLEADEQTLEEFLAQNDGELKELIDECGDRCTGINNNEKDAKVKERKVKKLIDMIVSNVEKNDGRYYTSAMMEAAEKIILKRQEELQRKKEEEVRQEREKVKREADEKLAQLEKEMQKKQETMMEQEREELRKRHEEELKRIEAERIKEEKRLTEKAAKAAEEARHQVREEITQGETILNAIGRSVVNIVSKGVSDAYGWITSWF
ncbi:GTPase IMAP family member 7-like [Gigantopelta aegis]|uniref:GTPase IMAP family member 7-like n=1 Tax=Gigantopelta aegis TaxID=1735272 RepID=UPI001B889469|nr:GTPase IMAP family member 7-like [Gigantopelta aegis]